MNRIVKTQAEWDALPASFKEFTTIEIRSSQDIWITVRKVPDNGRVEAWGSSHVEAWGSSHVEARESSHVKAWGSSHVEARGSSHVEAWESSHVKAWGSSHVKAWGSSHVEAWGSSHVEAWGSVTVSAQSEYSTLKLSAFAVAILLVRVKKLLKKSKTCTVVEAHEAKPHDTKSWAEWNGAPREGNKVTLFKRVSKDLKTQEDTENETTWTIGAELEVPDWNPVVECGTGKFHACFCASACDQYRAEKKDDRYIAIEVNIKDTHFFKGGSHPNKISFKKGKVLFECDRFGKRVN